jgi:hypothetical protein
VRANEKTIQTLIKLASNNSNFESLSREAWSVFETLRLDTRTSTTTSLESSVVDAVRVSVGEILKPILPAPELSPSRKIARGVWDIVTDSFRHACRAVSVDSRGRGFQADTTQHARQSASSQRTIASLIWRGSDSACSLRPFPPLTAPPIPSFSSLIARVVSATQSVHKHDMPCDDSWTNDGNKLRQDVPPRRAG